MKSWLSFLGLMFAFSLSFPAFTAVAGFFTRNPAATLHVVGDVDDTMALVIGLTSKRLMSGPLTLRDSKTINITVASDGGSVDSMKVILKSLSELRDFGYNFKCTALFAYSAAYMIWQECDERLVYPVSSLLFHRPYIGGARHITSKDATEMAEYLAKEEAWFVERLRSHTGRHMDDTLMISALDAEKTWTGEELCKEAKGLCTVID